MIFVPPENIEDIFMEALPYTMEKLMEEHIVRIVPVTTKRFSTVQVIMVAAVTEIMSVKEGLTVKHVPRGKTT